MLGSVDGVKKFYQSALFAFECVFFLLDVLPSWFMCVTKFYQGLYLPLNVYIFFFWMGFSIFSILLFIYLFLDLLIYFPNNSTFLIGWVLDEGWWDFLYPLFFLFLPFVASCIATVCFGSAFRFPFLSLYIYI